MTEEETKKVLLEHMRRYPFMQPQDVIKLLYQSEFGTGHIIDDSVSALKRLKDEMNITPADDCAPLFEEIGGGYSRINLAAAKAKGIAAEEILVRFIAASHGANGSLEGIKAKIKTVEELCRRGVYRFNESELESFCCEWLAGGAKCVSHSDEYRKNYSPAYRVVK